MSRREHTSRSSSPSTLPLPRSRVPAARPGATIAASRRAKGDAHYSPAGYLAWTVFANRDFTELRDGEVRLTHPLNAHLAHTAALWRKLAEPVADWLRDAFLCAVCSGAHKQLAGGQSAGKRTRPAGRMAGDGLPPKHVFQWGPAVPRLKPLAPLLPPLTGSPSVLLNETVTPACRECGRALPYSPSRHQVFCNRTCAASRRRAGPRP